MKTYKKPYKGDPENKSRENKQIFGGASRLTKQQANKKKKARRKRRLK
jgi:hypothetical protein